jgi:hypothetical protein
MLLMLVLFFLLECGVIALAITVLKENRKKNYGLLWECQVQGLIAGLCIKAVFMLVVLFVYMVGGVRRSSTEVLILLVLPVYLAFAAGIGYVGIGRAIYYVRKSHLI